MKKNIAIFILVVLVGAAIFGCGYSLSKYKGSLDKIDELEKENKKLKEDLENDYKDVDNCIKTEGVKTKEDDQKSTEKEVVYPDFTTGGYKIEDVEEFCKKYGLKLEVFYNEPDGTQIPSGKLPEENTVFVQEPVPGEKVVKGDTLHITIAVY